MQRLFAFLFCVYGVSVSAAPVFLDDQFELPKGFRIYRAAEKELTGGSYALRFDGQGRLLVGDGTALRRLADEDQDGVYDSFEVIATGLGWRGPQGILVYGDRLFCVGGDGIQLYEGYTNGPLRHIGRIGEKLNTGGDHDAHTLLRGHDGYIYFMAGNGSGLEGRKHITEETSPCLVEREASVFRISPDGKKWECIATGGRNPPNLGMNYLGDLFSWDSDMEWHVGLPFYRPTRLNHWLIGGDQGWHDVGALPSYYIDNVPPILETGRGSPNWGVFYEHNQFPKKYENAYLVCDYLWKGESTDDYQTTGRLVSFFLERSGARYKAKMETFARPKPGAKDANGRSIPFALVDIDVAADGSIYFTDHNQGIWRILFTGRPGVPPTASGTSDKSKNALLHELLTLPQPGSEYSRLKEESLRKQIAEDELFNVAIKQRAPLPERLRAIRLLAPGFSDLARDLANDKEVEIRAQAAWLAGLGGRTNDFPILETLAADQDPFVRRRAMESLLRRSPLPTGKHMPLLDAVVDPDRTLRYLAMMGLARRKVSGIVHYGSLESEIEYRLRDLIAHRSGGKKPDTSQVESLVDEVTSKILKYKWTVERQLDILRAIQLYGEGLRGKESSNVKEWISDQFPDTNPAVKFEQARLIGELDIAASFSPLLRELLSEKDKVRQFHFFQCLAKLTRGWKVGEERRLLDWVLKTQKGWFAEFEDKGVEFPLFLQTALEEFALHHTEAVLAAGDRIQIESLLGSVWLGLIAEREPQRIFAIYRESESEAHKVKALQAMARIVKPETAAFLRGELGSLQAPALRRAAVNALKAMPKSPENEPFLNENVASKKMERSDAEVHKTIMTASFDAGDALRGRKIYERLQCNSCHAGGQTPGQEGRIFGPDLVGVTARLNRAELADSMVYPSKQVPDRFKAVELTLKDGRELTGFVTERSANQITFADAQTIHRLAPGEIEKEAPQEKSLMPDGLLRTLSDEEITHLLKFLSAMGTK